MTTQNSKKIAYAEKKTSGIYDVTYSDGCELDRDISYAYIRRLERLGYEIRYTHETDD